MRLEKHPSGQGGQSQEGAPIGIGCDLLRLWENYSDPKLEVSLEPAETADRGRTMKAERAGSWEQV